MLHLKRQTLLWRCSQHMENFHIIKNPTHLRRIKDIVRIYTSITDCTPENILSPIWLRGKEFPQAKAHLETIINPETSTAIQSRRIHETLNDPEHMPKVGI